MGDTIANASRAVDKTLVAPEVKHANKEVDKSNWEWVTVPETDLFGDPHNGVSINFVKYTPELDDEGRPTGREGRYFVDPETAAEVRRLLQVTLRGQMRVMQPQQDKKMHEIMSRGNKLGAPMNANADNAANYR